MPSKMAVSCGGIVVLDPRSVDAVGDSEAEPVIFCSEERVSATTEELLVRNKPAPIAKIRRTNQIQGRLTIGGVARGPLEDFGGSIPPSSVATFE
jgi:hypothetical protein